MTDRYTQTENGVKDIIATLRDIAGNTAENIRLSAAERLTLLFSAIAVAALATILTTAIVLFASIGVARLLSAITPQGAYFIIAGFYALLLIILVLMRRRLIIDPICRLVTRLMVPPPANNTTKTETTPKQEP